MELLCLVVLLAGAALSRPEKSHIKYLKFNLDPFLANERLLKKAVQCVIGEGECPAGVGDLKELMTDALQHDCSNCSDIEKATAQKVLKFLIEKKPQYFDELEKKFDPEGVYRSKYTKQSADT